MTNQSPAEALREKLIDDLWGRALDMTSDDFKNDNDYLKAQSNYKKLCLKQLTAYAATVEREAHLETAKYFKKYMISTSPFIDEIVDPYIEKLEYALQKKVVDK